MKTILYSLFLLLGCCSSSYATVKSLKNEKQQLLFVENKGQVKDQFGKQRNDVSYSMKAGAGLTIFAQKGGLIYQFSEQSGKDSITQLARVCSKAPVRERTRVSLVTAVYNCRNKYYKCSTRYHHTFKEM